MELAAVKITPDEALSNYATQLQHA
jgi:hypothetical protein